MQHDTTTHNKVVKRYKLFLHNKCCMLLHEKLGSFDRGLRLIHMQPSTDTNMTSAQWCYLHNNIIFLVIILILKHVLVRLMQKYLILVINCLLCCMNWYSWGVIRSSHRIRTRSHCICIVVKFYNHTLRLRYGRIQMRYYPPLVLLL